MKRGDVEHTRLRATTVGLGVWVALIAAATLWPRLQPLPSKGHVNAPPYFGRWEAHDLVGLIPAMLLAVALVAFWPSLIRSFTTKMAPLVSGVASVVWAVALAVSAGIDQLSAPLAVRHGYQSVAESMDPSTFLSTFVDKVDRYPIHVKGHPPAAPLLFRWLADIGLASPQRGTIVVLAVWGVGVASVLAATVQIGGRNTMLRASGPVAFLPGVVWVATSVDALFAGLMALALSLIIIAATRPKTESSMMMIITSFLGGALGAFCLFLSYGLAPLALIAVLVVLITKRWSVAVISAAGGAIVVAIFAAKGFWWFDGLAATQGFYEEGISQFRPYGYFTFAGNPANLAIAVGPVTVAGLTAIAFATSGRLRTAIRDVRSTTSTSKPMPRIAWMALPIGALVAVTLADLSGLSKAEVERIWLPFMMWLAVGSAGIIRPRTERIWLAASLVTGLLLQGFLVTPW